MHSGRQTARQLIIFSVYVYVSQFYFGRHLILGVLVKFSGV